MMTRRQFIAHLGIAAAGRLLFDSQYFAAQTAQTKSLNLKITGLKTFVVNVGSVNWAFCKVYTNQGLAGLGEGSITSKEALPHRQGSKRYRAAVAGNVSLPALARRAHSE